MLAIFHLWLEKCSIIIISRGFTELYFVIENFRLEFGSANWRFLEDEKKSWLSGYVPASNLIAALAPKFPKERPLYWSGMCQRRAWCVFARACVGGVYVAAATFCSWTDQHSVNDVKLFHHFISNIFSQQKFDFENCFIKMQMNHIYTRAFYWSIFTSKSEAPRSITLCFFFL